MLSPPPLRGFLVIVFRGVTLLCWCPFSSACDIVMAGALGWCPFSSAWTTRTRRKTTNTQRTSGDRSSRASRQGITNGEKQTTQHTTHLVPGHYLWRPFFWCRVVLPFAVQSPWFGLSCPSLQRCRVVSSCLSLILPACRHHPTSAFIAIVIVFGRCCRDGYGLRR